MQDRKGGCLCRAVRYTLTAEPRAAAVCHCTNCQKLSGSLFSFNVVMREADYEQTGDTTVYVDKGDSGNPVQRHFCGRCGSPIFARTALLPGKLVVKAGTLDSLDGLLPQAEIYTDRAAKWLTPITGAKQFPLNV